MKNLKTKYMGIELDNPIILGACNMAKHLDVLKKAEEHGVAAIVYRSLFEEQIQLERLQMDEELTEFNDIYAEMLTIHPNIKFAGCEEHLLNIRKAKESLSIPIIASLNAINEDTWIEYAKLLCETGVDGIELNLYQSPSDFNKEAKDIEEEQINIVNKIKQNISIPVSVKLSPDYTNILNYIKKLDGVGVDAFVLFNSFFQPNIDIMKEKHVKSINYSKEGDFKQSLKYTGLLFDNIHADICSSHGVSTGEDVIKLILSGSSCVQVVSTVYKHGLTQIGTIKKELEDWMDRKNYSSIEEFRGKLSKNKLDSNSFVYRRAQYVDLLMNSENIFGDSL
ncbi:dihydroorotate dehydrogenase-like protein [uncultured Acetobacteroides sp.]|uniref:dihydroorotate dehydrogenase-like protein n=1 Tax=uncultured Acetobacteroides sp. TaxID=1760811 RepID=UPI0029F575C9|nr:dihydroorotate dehydrogenase-like protein [uncultured Acetobacteroides sp.]